MNCESAQVQVSGAEIPGKVRQTANQRSGFDHEMTKATHVCAHVFEAKFSVHRHPHRQAKHRAGLRLLNHDLHKLHPH